MENLNYNHTSYSSPTQKLKVLVADDQDFICMLVKKIIERSSLIECVGLAQDGRECLMQIQTSEPDVVVLDLELPQTDSIKLIESSRNHFPHTSFLVFTSHEEEEYLHRAIAVGARGYILKGCSDTELIDAILSVHKGYAQLSLKLLGKIGSGQPQEIPTGNTDNEDLEIWSKTTTESIESLPRVSLRLILYVLLGAVMITIPWLFLAQFEQIAKVKGKITPQQKVTIIDAPVSNKVKSVVVKEGQKVKVNQTLLTFDSRLTFIEQQQQQHKLKTQQKRLNKLKALKNQAQKLLLVLEAQFESEIAEKQAQITQTQTVIEAKNSELVEAKVNLEEANKKFQRYQKAVGQGALSIELVAEVQQTVKQENQNVVQAKTAIAEAQSFYLESLSAKKALSEAHKIKAVEAQKELEQIKSEILTVEAEKEQIQSLIASLIIQAKSQVISSPIEGIIFDSAIDKPGSVVERGEPLVSIAPKRSRLVFRGQILSKDVNSGFLKVGMPATIKLDSFSWREFGTVVGKIAWISPNSQPVADKQDSYDLEIQLNPHQNAKLRNYLDFGQTGVAEIVVRKKNLIDYIF